MSKPGVLITGINYAPEVTGIGVYTTNLARGLARRDWRVTVVTGIPHYPAWRPASAPWSDVDDENVTVIRRPHFIPRQQSIARRAAYETSWLAACLPQVLRRQRIDVLLGVTPSLGGGVLAALGGLRSRLPYVLMIQDLLGRGVQQSRFRSAGSVAATLGAAELLLARRASRVAVITEGFRSHLVACGIPAHQVHRIRNPVCMPPRTRNREEVRRRLGWMEDECIVIHSGNMGLKQGLENVLRAAQLAGPEERVRFVLQGDGSQRGRLEQLASMHGMANVDFLPLAPARELANVLGAADLLLVSQRPEVRDMSLPSKLTCYLAAGVAVVAAVASDSEAAREVAASGGGVIVEPGRPDVLLRAVRRLAAAREQREALGRAGEAFAESELHPDAALGQIEALLTSSVDRRGVAGAALA